jgi:YYY domain-containing protein
MLRKRTWVLLLVVLALRLVLQWWDVGAASSSPHPDERQVGFVTERIEGWFDDPDFYAYGSLHFQGVRAVTTVLGLGDQVRGLVTGGRVLSLLSSLLAIVIGWFIAHRAWGRRTAELFLLLVAWIPLDLQQSHFATVEAHHTAWVMLALAACFWLATGGRGPAAAASGAAFGASLAVKVSSLALGLPVAIAVLIAGRLRPGSWLQSIRLAVFAAGSACFAFWLCQPWAFANGEAPLLLLAAIALAALAVHLASLRVGGQRRALLGFAGIAVLVIIVQLAGLIGLGGSSTIGRLASAAVVGDGLNPSYLRGVNEQVSMVLGRADLPYVRVYHGTLPVLYSLRELAAWGFGALLLLAVIAGGAAGSYRLLRRWRRFFAARWTSGSTLLLILLAWLVPMTIRLSTLHVKYLRYWEPLVVPATLVAAWWLLRLPARRRRQAVIAVALGTIFWGLSYLWAFVEPHPHRTATRWLGPMLEDSQVVAFEHWDEALDLGLVAGQVERIDLPSYDLPDDADKVLRWSLQLARADWVVMTSNRVRRTVLANPERFPQTARLYRLLFAGEAGFEPVTRVSRGPRFFGLEWPEQHADESYVNYDFPQVVILRKISEVTPEALLKKVQRPLPYLEEYGAREIERSFVEPLPTISAVPSGTRQTIDVSIWVLTFLTLGAATWVLFLPVLRRLPDAGVGLALATGWVAPAWLMWFGSECGFWTTGTVTASWIFLGLAIAGIATLSSRRREVRTILRRRRAIIIRVLVVTAAVGALFLVVRAFNPAIHWGEKPMDFSFLNCFLRASHWPTGEPWMAGMPLHYYYFGEVLASFPILVSGCSAGVGYNLISATIPALGAAVLASLGLALARRRRWGAAVLPPLLVLLTGNLAWPWLIGLFREGKVFDLWWATSRVIPGFAIDEYPLWTTLFADLHGHFIALPVLLTTLAWGWLCVRLEDRRWVIAAVLCGICASILVTTNPWDLFILTTTLGLGALVAGRQPLVGLGRLVMAAAVSVIAASPFVVELVEGIGAGAGGRGIFLTDADFAPAWAVLRHFGLFLLPLAILGLIVLGRRTWIVVPVAGVGVIAGFSFSSSAAAVALALTALFTLVSARASDRISRLGWSLAALGTLAIAACERFTLIDRMNTIFKVYNGVWVLLALALATALLRTRGRQRRLLVTVWLPLQLIALVNLPLGIAQGWMQPRVVSPRPTLDGQAFLRDQDPQSWFLVRALEGVARPHEAIAEAAGNSYGPYTRIAMHTGQPTVVGWEWHLQQRGQSMHEITARFADLETLYASGDQMERRAVLDRYRLGWVVLADIERERYGLFDSDPLAGIPGLVQFSEFQGAALYRVSPLGGRAATPIAPVFELPEGVRIVGEIPARPQEVIRSLALDDRGATVMLRDGSAIDLDFTAQDSGVLASLPCNGSSIARRAEDRWASCADGSMWRLDGDRWTSIGRLPEAGNLTAADEVWAWGDGGVWQHQQGRQWRQIFAGGVTAAAATGPGIAWSDGRGVWVGRGGPPRPVATTLDQVHALAWQGSVLWALDAAGLHRSGGALLPWRRAMLTAGPMVAAAGSSNRLWVVLEDGLILESKSTACASPWQSEGAPPGKGLDEPRGLAVSPSGWFVVTDTLNHRLRWYSTQGVCLDEIGSEGSIPGAFREPSGLALGADGTLAVADTWNGRVQLLRTDGSIKVLGGELYGPRGLLWTPDGGLLVSDTGNRRVLLYRPPDWQEEVVAYLAGPPVGLAWAGGLVAAAIPAEAAVALINLETGSVVRSLEIPGWRNRDQQEGHLVLLPSGELVASAPQPGELWVVDPAGAEPPHLLRDGLPGITAMALMPDGEILASLTWDDRLVRVSIED